jgi:hypothetical protein
MSSPDRHEKDQKTNRSLYQQSETGVPHAVEPSGAKGDNPAPADPAPTKVQSGTQENRPGHINPSAPEDANTTPGTAGQK